MKKILKINDKNVYSNGEDDSKPNYVLGDNDKQLVNLAPKCLPKCLPHGCCLTYDKISNNSVQKATNTLERKK